MNLPETSRRTFLKTVATASAGLAFAGTTFAEENSSKPKIKLGLDNFSVRAMKWNASQLIDYAAKLKTDSLFITDLNPETFASFEENYLRDLKKKAEEQKPDAGQER